VHADVRCQCLVGDLGGRPWLTLRPWLVAADPRVREAALRRAAQATSVRKATGRVPFSALRCLWDRDRDVRSAAQGLLLGRYPGDDPASRVHATRGRSPRGWPIHLRERRCLEHPSTRDVAEDLIDLMADASCRVRRDAAIRLCQGLGQVDGNPNPATAVLEPLSARLVDTASTLRRVEPCRQTARAQDELLVHIADPDIATAAAGRLAAGAPEDRASIPPGRYRDEAQQQSDPDTFVRTSALEQANRYGRAWAWEWPPEPSGESTVDEVFATFSRLWQEQAEPIPTRSTIEARCWEDAGTVLPDEEPKRERLVSLLGVAADRRRALPERFAAVDSIHECWEKYDYATAALASDATLALLAEVADSQALPESWQAWTSLFGHLPVIHDHGGHGLHEVTSGNDLIGLGDLPPRHLHPSRWMAWWEVTDDTVGRFIWGFPARRDPLWTSAMTRLAVRADQLLGEAAVSGEHSDGDVARLGRVAAFAPGRSRCLYTEDGTQLVRRW
jgi:hypothetical protein